ncbi:MAG: hypothetical protein M3Y56_14135, partial [Armatimonadota bacterium]|nr:hypothetical protein [Armatimonadota bacterium]
MKRLFAWMACFTVMVVNAGCAAPVAGIAGWVRSSTPSASSPKDFQNWLIQHPDSLKLSWRAVGAAVWDTGAGGWTRTAGSQDTLSNQSTEAPFTAVLTTSNLNGALRVKVIVSAVQDLTMPYQITLSSPFAADEWNRQFYPGVPYFIRPPEDTEVVKFLANAHDSTTVVNGPDIVGYPFGVLENNEGYLFWGAMDIGKFCVLTPNVVPHSIPAFSYQPNALAKGSTLEFNFCMKWFPKPSFLYRDVLRWYLKNMSDSDPLTKDWVHWDG